MKLIKFLKRWIKKLFGIKPPKRYYGWKRDKYDHRDKRYKMKMAMTQSVSLPPLVDLRDKFPEAYNQSTLGSCTAQAIAAMVKYEKNTLNDDMNPSRLFIYYNEREMEGNIGIDCGAAIRDGIKTINKIGVCHEELWPYNIEKFALKPEQKCYEDAQQHKSVVYEALDGTNIQELKSCLAEGNTFVFGFQVYQYFESEQMAYTGILRLPTPWEKCYGGHAVLAVGYDDSKQAFIIRNSWGKEWGLNGYFYMPYDYIKKPTLACDFWTIKIMEDEPEEKA